MDNLFNSVNFTVAAATCKTQVLTQGVLRKHNWGAPPCILQDDKTGKAANDARGTVKAAVLKGDPRVHGIIVASVYDQKPFYMITNVAREITWNEVTKKVWSDQLRKNIEMKFLRFCISHNYNFEMNDNDIADQLRLQYQLMQFCRNVKWWWALWLWGFEVSLVNAYMLYRRYHDKLLIKTKYNHYKFIEMCAKAYIDPVNHWPTRNRLHIRQIVNNSLKEERQRCVRLTSNLLCHLYGMLKCRRDMSLSHFPQPSQKKKNPTQCQLHMWA